jgi:hypothetical protein
LWLNAGKDFCMYLATICNSMIIEMCDDIIRVSHGFRGCQMLRFIAIGNSARIIGIDGITSFFGLSKFQISFFVKKTGVLF